MSKMKIFFVGTHNKPGLMPLDSKSRTGKIIDRIIEKLEGFECVKTNLFDCNYQPVDDQEIQEHLIHWYNKTSHEPYQHVVVALSALVHKVMKERIIHIVPIKHPSYVMRYGKVATDEYIEAAVFEIKEQIAVQQQKN